MNSNMFYIGDLYSQCGCTQIQTCPHVTHIYTGTQSSYTLWWQRYDEWFKAKQYARVKPEPIPYYRPAPRPISFKRTSGRGMFIRRTKPWNLRNKPRRKRA